MKILVNAQPLLHPLSGVGQYTYQLYREMLNLQTPCRFYYRYHYSKELKTGGGEFANALERLAHPTYPSRMAMNVARKFTFLTASQGLGKGSLYHEPNFIPFRTPLPTVITIHDLSVLRVPETHRPKWVEIFSKRIPEAVAKARRIIAVSEFARQEVIDYFPEAESKTFVTLEGVRDNYRPMGPEATAPSLAALGLTHGRYLLAVGTLEPRKNLARAITAYSALPKETRRHYPLAIAGMKGWLNHEFEEAITRLVDAGEAKILGFVPDDSMNALYAGAKLLVYPSIYEGFGLPPLEAMASGTPVITSNCSSLPEVVGDAGIQVDPYDCDAIHAAFSALIDDDALHQRLRQASIQRAKTFTWRRTAEETLKIFQDLSAELTG
jgi:alpha-1,3-rhamnosyl/mannosyltransferase